MAAAIIRASIARSSALPLAPLTEAERRGTSIADRALTIYTSGTTGLPKAANVSHRRLMQWSLWFAGLMNTGPDDRMYDCLPMYHSVGGVVATGALLVRGGSVVMREKFSAQQFWDDICDWDCTLFQYIGELCRYLVNAPDHPREREHRLAARLRQRAARRRLGGLPVAVSPFRAFWNSTPRPKAMSRSTTSRASRARSAAYRRSSRIVSARVGAVRRRHRGAPARDAATDAASAARPAKPARRSAGSRRRGERRRAIRRLYQRRRFREEDPARRLRSRATPGCAPAI